LVVVVVVLVSLLLFLEGPSSLMLVTRGFRLMMVMGS
jgi:hypothetical protein